MLPLLSGYCLMILLPRQHVFVNVPVLYLYACVSSVHAAVNVDRSYLCSC